MNNNYDNDVEQKKMCMKIHFLFGFTLRKVSTSKKWEFCSKIPQNTKDFWAKNDHEVFAYENIM